ncbi:MAG TPA: hypothetical protein VEZ44_10010 [bacterium]|nr:hypothetical protein [bacterium]
MAVAPAARRGRLALLVLSILALLAGMWAGLERLGWTLPVFEPALAAAHGPLMVSGFLGTLISLERAVAIQEPWAYAAPLLSGLGGLALLGGMPAPVGPLLITLGSLGLVGIFGRIMWRRLAWFTVVMEAGALAWLMANVAWLAGAALPVVVSWLAGFLVLTIVGERLDLSRLVGRDRGRQAVFIAIVAVYALGLALVGATGQRIAGIAMAGLAGWLWRYDIARRIVGRPGLPRFIAVGLLSGYAWLGVGGVLWMVFGGALAGPRYDAMLHAVFLGFVFSMVFAHAPIILPAVLGRAVPYRAWFYSHIALLNLSLVARLAGDLGDWYSVRAWGGLLSVAAILLFLLNTLSSAATARPARPHTQGPRS